MDIMLGIVLTIMTNFMADEPSTNFLRSRNVSFVGNWPYGTSHAVQCDSARNLVFLGSGGGVYVMSISDPANPTILSERIRTRGIVLSLAFDASDCNLYIAGKNGGLEIWNTMNPWIPVRLGGFYAGETGTIYKWVYIAFPYAYVYDWTRQGILMLDVSDPANVHEISFYQQSAVSMFYDHGYIYITDYSGLRIIDVSNPLNPHEAGFLYNGNTIDDVCVSGNYAYVCEAYFDSVKFEIIDVTDPSNPSMIGTCHLSVTGDIQVHNGYAYVGSQASNLDGFVVIDVTDLGNPHISGILNCNSLELAIYGSYACTVTWEALNVIDISDPFDPQLIGQVRTPRDSWDVFVRYPYAYLAEYQAGLYIIDISNPSLPEEIGYLELPFAQALHAIDTLLYIATDDGIIVVDVSNPAQPHIVGSCDLPGDQCDIQVSGNYAYTAATSLNGDRGMHIVDISDPSAPFPLNGIGTAANCYGLCVRGHLAYLAADDLFIVDIQDPASPQVIGQAITPCEAEDVSVAGQYACIMDGSSGSATGLRIYDISDSTNPLLAGYIYTGDFLDRCVARDTLAFISAHHDIHVISFSNPSSPYEIGFYNSPTMVHGIFVDHQTIYIANWTCGLQICNYSLTAVDENAVSNKTVSRFQLIQNPVPGSQVILKLVITDMSANNSIGIFDATGRQIEKFPIKSLNRGEHIIHLPLSRYACGVYFLKWRGDNNCPPLKLVITN